MARIPQNQLLDQLFSLFCETSHWSIRLLREKTQQPEAYLKEVLAEIAFLHNSGDVLMAKVRKKRRHHEIFYLFTIGCNKGPSAFLVIIN
jgi:hypothetical protein